MKKRFLVTSILMLLLTVFALSTSTYAWFSMNTKVSATGMEVIAKTDDTYLIISKTNNTASAIQAENANKGNVTVNMAVDNESTKVYASAPCLNDSEKGYLTIGTALPEGNGHKDVDGELITTAGAVINDFDSAALVTNWYTAKALTANEADIDTTTVRQLTSLNGYVIKKTVYLTVAKGANDAYNLTVTGTFEKKDDNQVDLSACKVLVVTSNSDLKDGDDNKGGFAVISSENPTKPINFGATDIITDTTVVTVDMYIYYDGNDDNVYTNNADKLAGATITLAFEVEAKTE